MSDVVISEPFKANSVALVVPCYNPRPGWGALLGGRFSAFAKTQPDASLINLTVVHDGTPGGLEEHEVRDLRIAVPNFELLELPQNRGKGYALRTGMQAAPAAEVYVYTDVDLPYTLDSMARVVATVRELGGVAAGERFSDYYAGVPKFRRRLSRTHRWLMRTMFRLPISDSQAGLKAFDKRGRTVFLETTVDRFLVDLDFIARCRGRAEVRAVRVALRPDVTFTDFGFGILRAEAGNFIGVLRRAWLGR